MDDKIKEFEEICNRISLQEKEKLEEELKEKLADTITQDIEEYKNKLEKKYKEECFEMQKQYNNNIINLQIDAKKKILTEKQKMQNELFQSLVCKFKEYCLSDEYKKDFTKMYKYTKTFLENQSGYIIGVVKQDIQNLEQIEDNYDLEILPDKYIGGILLKNKNMVIDNTIYTNLKESIYGTEGNN